jgi:lysophospholipase L1-like esterase
MPSPTRIACIGDSITFGSFIFGRARHSYPARLQRQLGAAADVLNFGAVDYCLQRTADKPYTAHRLFQASLSFAPDVVLIMLGTNDSKAINWRGIDAFLDEYRAFLDAYRALDTAPRIVIAAPPAAFPRWGKVQWSVIPAQVSEIAAALPAFARAEGMDFVDIHGATKDHPEWFRLDGIHPGRSGAAQIAEAMRRVL